MSTDSAHHDPRVAHHFRDAAHQYESSKQGIWLFMVTEILMFGGLFVAYAIFHGIYPEMFAEGASYLNWKMGFLNTLVLIFSSLTMAMGIYFIQHGQKQKANIALITTILCGFVFMVVKYFEYTHKFHDGIFPGKFFTHEGIEHANLALYFSFYFTMTGLHGLHVIIGMSLITWVLIRNIRGDFDKDHYTAVEGVGIFWHIVDLIWIYLFPILYLIG